MNSDNGLNPLAALKPQQLKLVKAYIESGHDRKKAQKIAGYKSNCCWNTPRVKAAIEHAVAEEMKVLEAHFRGLTMSKAEAMAILSRDARAELIDFLDDNMTVKFDKNTKGVGALQEFEESVLMDGTVKRKVKLPARVPAIDKLSKVMGWEHVQDDNPKDVAQEIHDELQEIARMEEDEEYEVPE